MNERPAVPARVRGYVRVMSGIDARVDSMNVFKNISAWVAWQKQYADVALCDLLADPEGDRADSIIIPAHLAWWNRWFWRLRARWLNRKRRAANIVEAERLKKHFSQESIDARVRARAT